MFSDHDLKQIRDRGLTREAIDQQIERFHTGFPPAVLHDAATVREGLLNLSRDEITRHISHYEDHREDLKIVKFVPASGAATRMFKTLFEFLNNYDGTEEAYREMTADQRQDSVFNFFRQIEKFAFYDELKAKVADLEGETLQEIQLKRGYARILRVLLADEGLNYGNLPKGLLKFHQYPEGSRTPVEEHIVEGAAYAKDHEGNVNLHFTVSPEHLQRFEAHVDEVKGRYETKFGVKVRVTYSIQKLSTDTIAVELNNEPFRDDDGALLFRPAGHGALLENLNDLDADIVFLKNIDNVVPDRLKEETITYKKVIAGVLLYYKERIAEAIADLENGTGIAGAVELLGDHLGYRVPARFDSLTGAEKLNMLKAKLNRPLRVCGMVQSEGDPGGGPFWVKANDGSVSLQIVETAQIDLKDPGQKEIFNRATHFNPVDVACYLKDAAGRKFDLMKYRDPDAGFITKKSKDGKDLKAQELPGLWNGSMADWNTVFVEVPAITFNPVKSVNDLLKDEHQNVMLETMHSAK